MPKPKQMPEQMKAQVRVWMAGRKRKRRKRKRKQKRVRGSGL